MKMVVMMGVIGMVVVMRLMMMVVRGGDYHDCDGDVRIIFFGRCQTYLGFVSL